MWSFSKNMDVHKVVLAHLDLVWLSAYSMNTNFAAVFMIIWHSSFSFDILMISEQWLSTDHPACLQKLLPPYCYINFSTIFTIHQFHLYLKNVHKTLLNFKKGRFWLKMAHCLAYGPQKFWIFITSREVEVFH